jgi:hypothetical protein
MLFTGSSLLCFLVFLEEYINWALISEKLIKYLEGQILMVDKNNYGFNVCPNMKHIHSMTVYARRMK